MYFFHCRLINVLSHELVRQYDPLLLKFHERKPHFIEVGMKCLFASVGNNDCLGSEVDSLVFHFLVELDILFRVLDLMTTDYLSTLYFRTVLVSTSPFAITPAE